MSIDLMTEVRDRIFDSPTEKLVAMRLADIANDDGAAIYPKRATVASDCLISERRLQEIFAKFLHLFAEYDSAGKKIKDTGLLQVVEEARGHRQRTYKLNPDDLVRLPLTKAAETRRARKRERQAGVRGATHCAPRGATHRTPDEARGATHRTPRGATHRTPIRTIQGTVLSIDSEESMEHARTTFALTPPEQPPPKRGTRLSPDWQPSERDLAFAIEQGLTQQEARHEAEQFRDHWLAASGAKACKRDWSAGWRTWCRNAIKWQQERSRSGSGRRGPASSAEAFLRGAGLDPDALDRS